MPGRFYAGRCRSFGPTPSPRPRPAWRRRRRSLRPDPLTIRITVTRPSKKPMPGIAMSLRWRDLDPAYSGGRSCSVGPAKDSSIHDLPPDASDHKSAAPAQQRSEAAEQERQRRADGEGAGVPGRDAGAGCSLDAMRERPQPLPWNNNAAENAIKQFAYYREGTVGVVSEAGLNDYLLLLSIHQTCRYRGISFLKFLLSKERDMDVFCAANRKRRQHRSVELYPDGFTTSPHVRPEHARTNGHCRKLGLVRS